MEDASYSNQTLGMVIAHIATIFWCSHIILVATRVICGNMLSCNTRLSLLVHHLLRHGQVAIARSSNAYGAALVTVATPTTIAKAYVATPRCCKSKTHFATISRKVLSKALPTQAPATPHNEKKCCYFWYCNYFGPIATLFGRWNRVKI